MHTVYVIAAGLLLLGLFALSARGLSDPTGMRRRRLLLGFIPAWFACAAYNMWVGVSQAGYSIGDELPIFLVVFAVPAMLALWLWRRQARSR